MPPSTATPTPRPVTPKGLRALEKACPLLVPLVEEGWGDASNFNSTHAAQAAAAPPQVAVTAEVIRIYLDELFTQAKSAHMNPDVLVLGCTHYPLLRPLIESAVPPGIRVIDSAEAAAEAAQRLFLQPSSEKPLPTAQVRCFATDSVEKFARLGTRFLGQPVGEVQLVDLGG
jgi:glutamate racemase